MMTKPAPMIRNIITIAIRILVRNKFFSLINILGLSIGISCALLIFTIVRHELGYDRFHAKRDHLFVMEQDLDLGTGPYRTDRSGAACGPGLKDAFPEVNDYIRFSMQIEVLMNYELPDSAGLPRQKKFIENAVLAVDSNFLDYFSFPVVTGNASTPLEDPWSLIMTRESAEKYFGNENPVGNLITVNSRYNFTVTAVVEDPPSNSSIQFDFLINFRFLGELGYEMENYNGNPHFTFLYLEDPEVSEELGPRITEFLDQHQDNSVPADQFLLPLVDFHLKGEQRGSIFTTLLTILGIILLAIACINFMNLTTARYLTRTREVGVRKVVGAGRGKLVRQFLGETMILVFFALNLSILAVDWILPVFNQNFQTDIDFHLLDPVMIGGLLSIFLITSLLAGSYPAFFLSSIKAVNVFSKFTGSRKRGGGIRKTLVVVQFIFTVVFIISTIVVYKQFALMKESSMGLDFDNIVYFPIRGELSGNIGPLKQEILQDPSVKYVTDADYVPRTVDRGELQWGLSADENNEFALVYPVGFDFAITFGVEMEEGHFYDENMPADTASGIVINRSVADALALEEPVGETFYLNNDPYIIIGVIKNYVFNPLSLSGDKVIMPFGSESSLCFVKTAGQNPQKIVSNLQALHEKFNPDYPFNPHYLDEYLDPITQALGNVNKLVYFFTLFGILISCMGLLGLSIFSTEQRTKEIGIRKALGANSQKILSIVFLDFVKLIFIALLIAIPVSIFLIRILLKLFAEKIKLGPGLFLAATGIVILLAMVTVSFQAIRSARSNPAGSLRYE